LTDPESTRRFRTGFRFGSGSVVAVVRPGSLVEQWRVLEACVAGNKIVIMQSANTGLTGGSTPDGDDYDRGVVLINTMRIAGLHLVNNGAQVVCLPGTTLFRLEKALRPDWMRTATCTSSTTLASGWAPIRKRSLRSWRKANSPRPMSRTI
jgi:D-lactate dehydrogenase (quinone)